MRFWGHGDRPVVEDADVVGLSEADVEAAYDRGRREERARHRSHPVLGLLVGVVALVGGAVLFLAASEGSFAEGGRVMDSQIAAASDHAQVASQDAAQTARAQLRPDNTSR